MKSRLVSGMPWSASWRHSAHPPEEGSGRGFRDGLMKAKGGGEGEVRPLETSKTRGKVPSCQARPACPTWIPSRQRDRCHRDEGEPDCGWASRALGAGKDRLNSDSSYVSRSRMRLGWCCSMLGCQPGCSLAAGWMVSYCTVLYVVAWSICLGGGLEEWRRDGVGGSDKRLGQEISTEGQEGSLVFSL